MAATVTDSRLSSDADAFRRTAVARRALGSAAIVLGMVQLIWHNFSTNWHPIPPEFPLRTVLVYLTGALLVAGGIATFSDRAARVGLLIIAAFYLFAEVFWIRRIVNFPQIFGTWAGFAEEFAPVIGAVLCYVALTAGRTPHPRFVMVGRALFGLCVISFGVVHIDALPQTAAMVPAWLPIGQSFWAVATGVAFIAFGIALVLGVYARTAALLTTMMLGGFGVLVWLPRIVAYPDRPNPWAGTAITVGVAAAAWIAAEVLAP